MGNEMQKYFRIHSETGEIYTKVSFDAEAVDHYVFDVIAIDFGKPAQRNGTTRVEVNV